MSSESNASVVSHDKKSNDTSSSASVSVSIVTLPSITESSSISTKTSVNIEPLTPNHSAQFETLTPTHHQLKDDKISLHRKKDSLTLPNFVPKPVSNANFAHFLKTHTIKNLKLPTKLVELDSSIDPMKGFEVLFTNNILSAPVYDSKSNQYVGFLDIRDLVSSVVFTGEKNDELAWTEAVAYQVRRVKNVKDAITCAYLARRNPFLPVKENATLFEISEILGKGHHRVPVLNNNGKCITIVSQSTIIQFLSQHLLDKELHDEFLQTVEDIGSAYKKVVCIGVDSMAVDAFNVLDKFRLSGLGVVDNDGRLVGNTSGTDLKLFVMSKGRISLHVPILEYLSKIRQDKSAPVDIRHPGSSVSPQTSISKVIAKLSVTKFHRLFVVDNQSRPTGVVALTDILRFATLSMVQIQNHQQQQYIHQQNVHQYFVQLQQQLQQIHQMRIQQQQQISSQHLNVSPTGTENFHQSPHFNPHPFFPDESAVIMSTVRRNSGAALELKNIGEVSAPTGSSSTQTEMSATTATLTTAPALAAHSPMNKANHSPNHHSPLITTIDEDKKIDTPTPLTIPAAFSSVSAPLSASKRKMNERNFLLSNSGNISTSGSVSSILSSTILSQATPPSSNSSSPRPSPHNSPRPSPHNSPRHSPMASPLVLQQKHRKVGSLERIDTTNKAPSFSPILESPTHPHPYNSLSILSMSASGISPSVSPSASSPSSASVSASASVSSSPSVFADVSTSSSTSTNSQALHVQLHPPSSSLVTAQQPTDTSSSVLTTSTSASPASSQV